MGIAAGRGAAAGPRCRTVLIEALALVALPVAVETHAAAAPSAREQAELLAQAGEARYRLALLRSRKTDIGPDLERALHALEEACELDPANLRALAYLGLARLESAARGEKPLDREAFDSVRGPLEELFRLSRGWADPRTRALLGEVARSVDASLAGRDDAPAAVLAWWRSWRGQVTKAAASAPPASNVVTLVEDLRTSPLAWVRERAAEKLAEREGKPQPGVVEALAKALREDKSPWVRAAAAKALSTLRPAGWDVRLAEVLRNDGSVYVRRTCAKGLARATKAGRPVRAALVEALGNDTPRVASASAWSLGALGGAEGELVSAIESPSRLVREAAAAALHLHSDDVVTAEKARPLMESARPDVRAATLVAVGAGPGYLPDDFIEKVVFLLTDKDALVRRAAANVLFRRDIRSAEEPLRRLLADENLLVRLTAADTLLAAGDESARPVLKELARSKAPLPFLGHGMKCQTVGEVARWILSERGKKRGTRP